MMAEIENGAVFDPAAGEPTPRRSIYDLVKTRADELAVSLTAEELAALAERSDMGESELQAVASVFEYLAEKHHETTIATMLKMSRLPRKEPKTFGNFDYGRIQGRDAGALRKLSALSNLHARKNIALIGPHGVGKTHLAQAYGRECCQQSFKAYFLKASELRDKLSKAAKSPNPGKTVSSLVKPSCLIVDEVGRCTFDKACTDLFFDIIDRRYEKECPNTLILTSNYPVVNWSEFFTGDETLLCMLDRIFDKATVFMMRGPSYRGAGLDTYSVEAVPNAVKLK